MDDEGAVPPVIQSAAAPAAASAAITAAAPQRPSHSPPLSPVRSACAPASPAGGHDTGGHRRRRRRRIISLNIAQSPCDGGQSAAWLLPRAASVVSRSCSPAVLEAAPHAATDHVDDGAGWLSATEDSQLISSTVDESEISVVLDLKAIAELSDHVTTEDDEVDDAAVNQTTGHNNDEQGRLRAPFLGASLADLKVVDVIARDQGLFVPNDLAVLPSQLANAVYAAPPPPPPPQLHSRLQRQLSRSFSATSNWLSRTSSSSLDNTVNTSKPAVTTTTASTIELTDSPRKRLREPVSSTPFSISPPNSRELDKDSEVCASVPKPTDDSPSVFVAPFKSVGPAHKRMAASASAYSANAVPARLDPELSVSIPKTSQLLSSPIASDDPGNLVASPSVSRPGFRVFTAAVSAQSPLSRPVWKHANHPPSHVQANAPDIASQEILFSEIASEDSAFYHLSDTQVTSNAEPDSQVIEIIISPETLGAAGSAPDVSETEDIQTQSSFDLRMAPPTPTAMSRSIAAQFSPHMATKQRFRVLSRVNETEQKPSAPLTPRQLLLASILNSEAEEASSSSQPPTQENAAWELLVHSVTFYRETLWADCYSARLPPAAGPDIASQLKRAREHVICIFDRCAKGIDLRLLREIDAAQKKPWKLLVSKTITEWMLRDTAIIIAADAYPVL